MALSRDAVGCVGNKLVVIGCGKSSRRKSEAQVIEEYGRAPDAQQLHDAMMSPTSSAARLAMTSKLAPAPTREQFPSQ